jgi:hypothetical protein
MILIFKLQVGIVTKAIPRGKKGIAIKGENSQLPHFRHIVNECKQIYNYTWFLLDIYSHKHSPFWIKV